MSESTSCCSCCLSLILSLGFTALFVWLSLRASPPTFSIQNIYVPALNTTNTTAAAATATTVTVWIKIENSNKFKGIYYDALMVTLYYAPNLSSSPVGNDSIPGFYQGHHKKATKQVNFQEVKIPWKTAVNTVSSDEEVSFRVDLATAVRYTIVGRKTGRHRFRVHGDVSVGKQGKKTKKKPIKMKSAASGGGFRRHCFVRVIFSLLILCVLNSFHGR